MIKLILCKDDIDYTPDNTSSRASIDVRHNNHGIKLLDLCIATGLRIVNGRLGNSNNYTFLSHNGCSVIDYLHTCNCNVNPFWNSKTKSSKSVISVHESMYSEVHYHEQKAR